MCSGPRLLVVLTALLATAMLVSCGGAGPTSNRSMPPTAELQRLLALVNEARSQPRTCGATAYPAAHPLVAEPRLMAAAHVHSADMHEHGFMGHMGSDGSSVSQRVEREGYAWSALGENVAWGYASPDAVMDGWLSSPGHCANIMRLGFTEVGLGLVGTHWTQVFANPR
ncbi:MAG: CAP domain-containing protein [Trueperaceae bacterium]|nr:MAG: CAP domain-containing protein [Trueperaceae bacterium]